MRLAIAIPDVSIWRGGTERCVAALAEALGTRHEVTVFARAAEGLDTSRVRFVPVRVPGRPAVLRYLAYLRRAPRARRRAGEFDLVYSAGANDPAPDVLAAHYCLGAAGTALGPDARPRGLAGLGRAVFNRIAGAVERRVYRSPRVRCLTAVSSRLADDLARSYGVPRERIEVVPDGVDLARFDAARHAEAATRLRAELGAGEGTIVLLFLGSDWERKGLPVALEAASRLGDADWRLWVAGYGDAARYTARAHALGIAGRVRFLGERSDAEVLCAACDALVSPTRYEPFGLGPIEAGACGRPSVVSKTAGVAEHLADGESALLVADPTSAEEVAEKLRVLLDAGVRRAMGERAREVARSLSWEHVARRVEAVLESALAEKRGEEGP